MQIPCAGGLRLNMTPCRHLENCSESCSPEGVPHNGRKWHHLLQICTRVLTPSMNPGSFTKETLKQASRPSKRGTHLMLYNPKQWPWKQVNARTVQWALQCELTGGQPLGTICGLPARQPFSETRYCCLWETLSASPPRRGWCHLALYSTPNIISRRQQKYKKRHHMPMHTLSDH